MVVSMNGGATATTTPRIVRGASVVHQNLDKRQRACLAADVLAALAVFQPSARQLSTWLGVSLVYIRVAARLSPEKRKAILEKGDLTPFCALLNPPTPQVALPAPKAGLANEQIVDFIDRMLDAAAEVERAMHA
jgi:hypothetical protein